MDGKLLIKVSALSIANGHLNLISSIYFISQKLGFTKYSTRETN